MLISLHHIFPLIDSLVKIQSSSGQRRETNFLHIFDHQKFERLNTFCYHLNKLQQCHSNLNVIHW